MRRHAQNPSLHAPPPLSSSQISTAATALPSSVTGSSELRLATPTVMVKAGLTSPARTSAGFVAIEMGSPPAPLPSPHLADEALETPMPAAFGVQPIALIKPERDFRVGLQLRLKESIWPQVLDSSGFAAEMKKVSLKVGQPTWKSWAMGIGTKGNWSAKPLDEIITTGMRPREDLNLTLAQYNLALMSKQTAFQFKGSDLLKAAEQILFNGDRTTALDVIPRSAKQIGEAASGDGQVVELTYSLGVKSESHILQSGEHAFFGEGVDNSAGFAKLRGNLTYSKLFKEIKAYPTLGTGPLSKFVPVSIRLESRPEISGERTISDGKIVSRQFLQQNQATLERIRLKIQFTVDQDVDLKNFLINPTVPAIHDMLAANKIKVRDGDGCFDPSRVRSYVPSHGVVGDGGLRLSAVNERPSFKPMTDLTGPTRLRWDPQQTNLDVVVQDPVQLSGKAAWLNPFVNAVVTPDRWAAQARHWVNQKVTAINDSLPPSLQPMRGLGDINEKLPSWLQFGSSLPQYVPTPGALYEAMTGINNEFAATSGTRYTFSVGSPSIPIPYFKLLGGTAEGRVQMKTAKQSVAPAISSKSHAWPRDAIEWSRQTHSHQVVPKGGYEELDSFLKKVDPSYKAAVDRFRSRLLPLFREPTENNPNPEYTGFLSPKNLDDIDEFLKSVAEEPRRQQ
jgi:hypothetical protein